jgi:hypothetical protein
VPTGEMVVIAPSFLVGSMLISSDIENQGCFLAIDMAHKPERKSCSVSSAQRAIPPGWFFLVPSSCIRI